MKIEARPWKPQDLLDDLREMIEELPNTYMSKDRDTLCTALAYLEEYFGVENSRFPLTQQKLRQMHGKSAYCLELNTVVKIIAPKRDFIRISWNIPGSMGDDKAMNYTLYECQTDDVDK